MKFLTLLYDLLFDNPILLVLIGINFYALYFENVEGNAKLASLIALMLLSGLYFAGFFVKVIRFWEEKES